MRDIFRDKLTATAVAVMLVYLFLLQAFVAGMTQGAMAASAADPLHVICTTDGADDVSSGPAGPAGSSDTCPCSTLCSITGLAAPAVLGGQDHIYLIAVRAEPVRPQLVTSSFTPSLRGFVPGPRAPPLLS